MSNELFLSLKLKISSLSIFKNLKNHALLQNFVSLVDEIEEENKLYFYSNFISLIYENGGNLTDFVKKIVFEDENVYIKMVSNKAKIPSYIQKSLELELSYLEEFSSLTRKDFLYEMSSSLELEDFESYKTNLKEEYEKRLSNIEKFGYGIFASSTMFRFSEDKDIVPIISADLTRLSDFIGYDLERNKLLDNTNSFMNNHPAFNVLLYGDAGTGKSSSVKAVVNHFSKRGLRLIELRKDQIQDLPLVMEKIRDNPLKFIIFIDDLSFNKNDDNFSMLKAILEGSASSKSENALIYCTSNRRHLIKESFSERGEDDLHKNDTIQETLSLVERFGLTIAFYKPDKKLYLEIVHELVKENGINKDLAQIDIQAEEFALRKGSRSPRCARQFIKSLM